MSYNKIENICKLKLQYLINTVSVLGTIYIYYIYHHSYYLVVHLSVTNEHIAYINIKIHQDKDMKSYFYL